MCPCNPETGFVCAFCRKYGDPELRLIETPEGYLFEIDGWPDEDEYRR